MSKFKELGVSDKLVDNLNARGIKKPTPIQNEAIMLINEGLDIIAEADTGTGKTLAFLLPLFDNMKKGNNGQVQALILTPTRELAIQIAEEAEKLNEGKKLNILAAYGGTDINKQLNKLRNNIDIIIATPGRLIDHIERKTIQLKQLKTLVIDEADQMLLMGFKNEIDSIISAANKKRQTLCFSATISPQVKKLAYRITKEPQIISIEKEEVILDNIQQFLIETTDRQKQDALCQMLNRENPFMAIIFCRTKRRVDALEDALYMKGFNSQKLHSDIPQSKREQIMKSFKNTEIQFLVATDVASRGLDISGVTHVFNYDVPESVETYIHRIGRTGRAGEEGKTLLFTAKKDREYLRAIEAKQKNPIPRIELEHIDDVQVADHMPKPKYNKRINTKPAKFNGSKPNTKSSSKSRKKK